MIIYPLDFRGQETKLEAAVVKQSSPILTRYIACSPRKLLSRKSMLGGGGENTATSVKEVASQKQTETGFSQYHSSEQKVKCSKKIGNELDNIKLLCYVPNRKHKRAQGLYSSISQTTKLKKNAKSVKCVDWMLMSIDIMLASIERD